MGAIQNRLIMQALEKMLFLEITSKQFTKLPGEEYYNTWGLLSEEEKKHFGQLSREVHQVWTHLNSKPIAGVFTKRANTIEEYNVNVQPISAEILNMARDYDLTLQDEITDEFKNAYIKIFGKDSFNRLFGN